MESQNSPDAHTPHISSAELSERIVEGNIFVVDVRRSVGSEQIYGAIRYNPRHLLDAGRLMLPLPKSDIPIVFYDEAGDGPDLGPLLAKFRESGYAELRVLQGGFKAWRGAAHRTEDPTLEQPVPTVESQELIR